MPSVRCPKTDDCGGRVPSCGHFKPHEEGEECYQWRFCDEIREWVRCCDCPLYDLLLGD